MKSPQLTPHSKVKDWSLSPKNREPDKGVGSHHCTHHGAGASGRDSWASKEMKGAQVRKEEATLSLFTDDMTLCIENPHTHTVQKVSDTGHKNQSLFQYTSNEQSKNEINKTIPLTIVSKRIKCVGINLIKGSTSLVH